MHMKFNEPLMVILYLFKKSNSHKSPPHLCAKFTSSIFFFTIYQFNDIFLQLEGFFQLEHKNISLQPLLDY